MTRTARILIATALSATAIIGFSPARAETADRAFERVAASHGTGQAFRWVNALVPEASGDYVAIAKEESADAAFNRLAQSYVRPEAKWVNALLPAAAGDAVMVAASESADAQFIRHITYYTRNMLDRGGWINAYAPDSTYSAPNVLLAVAVGDGATTASV